MKIGKAVLIEKAAERQKELLMSYGVSIKDGLSKAEAHSMISRMAQEWGLGEYDEVDVLDDIMGYYWAKGWDD